MDLTPPASRTATGGLRWLVCSAALVIAALALAAGRMAAEPLPAAEPPMDFNAWVRFALARSPLLSNSVLEVELRQIDEADRRSELLPAFSVRTHYVLNPSSSDDRRYDLSFLSAPYDPIKAGVSLGENTPIT